MAYQDLLEQEGINSQFLAVLNLKRRVTNFTLVSGSLYQASFDLGFIDRLFVNGVEYTKVITPSNANEFSYSLENELLQIFIATPPNSEIVVAEYELYVGTFDAHFPRIPDQALSTSNFDVYYNPVIEKTPVLKASNEDILFGFLPSQTSEITLNNAEHDLERHLINSSFNKNKIKIYHWLDELETANVKLVYDGVMGNVRYSRQKVSIQTFETFDIFENEFRHEGVSFFAKTSFPDLNPDFQARPIPQIYGLIDGFQPINISFQADNPTTSDNRTHVVLKGQTGLGELVRTVPAAPSSTTTRTYLDNASGITIGDSVWIDKASDEYRIVTDVDYVSNYIEHDALSIAAVNGDLVKRGFVSKIVVRQQNVNYTAFYNRDYTISNALADNTSGFIFSNSLESNTGMPNTLSPSDLIACRVYGRQNDVTLGGPIFGSNDPKTNNLRNSVVIIVDLLKKAGIPESLLNSVSFTALEPDGYPLGFYLPFTKNNDFPKYKDVLIKIFQTNLYRFFLDKDRLFKLTSISPFPVQASKQIEEDEILVGSFSQNIDYSDIVSTVNIDFAQREYSRQNFGTADNFDRVSKTSDLATYLHGVTRTRSYQSLHADCDVSEAEALGDKILAILSEQKSMINFNTKNRFFETEIGEVIDVSIDALPSFDYIEDVLNTKRVVTVSSERGLDSVRLRCDIQKGIEDNSGVF